MKVLVKVPAGMHIRDAGQLALNKGCAFFVHNQALYGVHITLNAATGTEERLRAWLTTAPHGAAIVECLD